MLKMFHKREEYSTLNNNLALRLRHHLNKLRKIKCLENGLITEHLFDFIDINS